MKTTKLHFGFDDEGRLTIVTSEGYEITGLNQIIVPPLDESNRWGKAVTVSFEAVIYAKPSVKLECTIEGKDLTQILSRKDRGI